MFRSFFLIFICFFIVQCEPPHADLTKYREEKKKRELKKISQGDLMNLANKKANNVVKLLSLDANIDSLAIANKLVIKKILLGDSSDILKENIIMDAYAYNVENIKLLKDNEQLIDDVYLYNRPIISEDSLLGLWSISINLYDLAKE